MTLQRLALYTGGFMGPFGTVLIVPMFPELRREFDASSSAVNLGFSLYLFTFAAFLLFSGTLGERWGRRRTVRGTYLLYAASSLAAALAPTLGIFLAARAVQGIANAFITPLLLAGLAEMVPQERFGREVGIYSSFQALGGGLGPIVGGLAADSQWQYAFFGSAVVALLLAASPPDGEPRSSASGVQLRPLLTGRMVALGVAFFFAAAGPLGISVVIGVVARDEFLLSGTTTGVILFSGAMAALVLGPLWGRTLDRFGAWRVGPVAALLATCVAASLVFSAGALSLGALAVAVSGSASLLVVLLQSVGATIIPDNRGGALSFLLAFRFVGHAIGPILFVPLVDESISLAFLGAASLGLVPFLVLSFFAAQARSFTGATDR